MGARFALTVALWLLCLVPSHGAWEIISSESEKSAGGAVEHRRIALKENETGDDVTVDLALFSPKAVTLRVVDNPNGDDDLAAVMQRVRGLAGVNGGYFDPQNAPLGLMISEGKLISPQRKARLLSGVIVASKGRIELLRTAEYSQRKTATAALQCGPFLVDGGAPVPGLNNTKTARRTFIVTAGTDRVGLGFSSGVTLAEAGEILATSGLVPELKVRRALNLDGGSSSAFWFAGERGVHSIGSYKTVRNFVVVTPR
ncbi:MAG TPA: phosphodiester glycosidase family protein [Chthoniobacterales bacterium]|jgi:exopolysaccharide biosynthesis protein|nr:phosphodiester glycosidase family protein [Chthoniobacterales bacterium]